MWTLSLFVIEMVMTCVGVRKVWGLGLGRCEGVRVGTNHGRCEGWDEEREEQRRKRRDV
jgi:hypothetical protein